MPGGVRPEAPRSQDNRELARKSKEIFLASGRIYGVRRIAFELREAHGYTGGIQRVRRLMRAAGLFPKAKRKFKATTDSKHALPVAPQLAGAEVPDFTPQ
ncbi:MAG: IS3 family transposase [Betaproteobacteria bacterium]|nr:IS3 family transposase [Betaproteobacteria bacterium]